MKVSFVKLCGGEFLPDSTFPSVLEAFLRTSGQSLTGIAFHSLLNPAHQFTVVLESVVDMCPNIVKLTVSECPLCSFSVRKIAKLQKLQNLTITPTMSKHTSLELMAACGSGLFKIPSLKSLRLSTGTGKIYFPTRPYVYRFDKAQPPSNLVQLELHNLSAIVIPVLECCPHLRALSLPNTDMPDNIHEIARCCPSVAHLSINGFWVGGGSNSLVTLFQRLPLKTLCIDHTHLSDTSIRGMCAVASTLEELYMVDTNGHSDIVVYLDVFKKCTKLHTLCISSSDFFDLYINSEGDTDNSMDNISTLILEFSKSGSDASAVSVVNLLCPYLTTLYLTYIDDGIVNELVGLAANCADFRTLHVLEMRDKHVCMLQKRLPHLIVYVNPQDGKYHYDALSYAVQ